MATFQEIIQHLEPRCSTLAAIFWQEGSPGPDMFWKVGSPSLPTIGGMTLAVLDNANQVIPFLMKQPEAKNPEAMGLLTPSQPELATFLELEGLFSSLPGNGMLVARTDRGLWSSFTGHLPDAIALMEYLKAHFIHRSEITYEECPPEDDLDFVSRMGLWAVKQHLAVKSALKPEQE